MTAIAIKSSWKDKGENSGLMFIRQKMKVLKKLKIKSILFGWINLECINNTGISAFFTSSKFQIQNFFLFPECVIIVHAVVGAFSAHLLRQYEEKDERKRILGGGAGSNANGPWLYQYWLGLWDYWCTLSWHLLRWADESLCLCWERPVCHVGIDCGPSTCSSHCHDSLF